MWMASRLFGKTNIRINYLANDRRANANSFEKAVNFEIQLWLVGHLNGGIGPFTLTRVADPNQFHVAKTNINQWQQKYHNNKLIWH